MEDTQQHTSSKKEVKKTKEIRTNMAIVHFWLNWPKWSFSLFIFLATRSVRLPTLHHGIEIPLRRLQAVVDVEAQSYQSCATNAFGRREEELIETSKLELDRVSQSQAANRVTIQQIQEDVGLCTKSTQTTKNVLIQWLDANKEEIAHIIKSDNSICGEENREKLSSVLGGKARTVENELSSGLDEFILEAKRSLALVATYTLDRFDYDFEYFVTNRIQPALHQLETQKLSDAIFFSIDEGALQEGMRQNFAQVEDMLRQASEQILTMNTRIESLSSIVENFHSAYAILYGRLLEGAQFVRETLPPGAPLPDFFDVSVLPLADSFLSDFGYIPTGELNSIEEVLESSTRACLNILDSAIQSLTEQSNLQLSASYDDLSDSLAGILDFHDYDPPIFQGSAQGVRTISEEVQVLSRRGRDISEFAKNSLAKLKFSNSVENITDFEEGIGQAGTVVVADDTSAFAYLKARLPSFSLPGFLIIVVSWVYKNAWVLEVLIQAVRFWRLETIYSKGAIPHLPEIEYGDGDKDSGDKTAVTLFKRTILIYIAAPRSLVLILMSPLFVFILTIWKPHIVNSCGLPGEGTFLATNFLSPLLINEASIPGNAVFLRGEIQCQRSRRKICNRMETEVNSRYQSDVESMRDLLRRQEESETIHELFKICINQDAISHINESCCGLKGHKSECCGQANTSSVCPIDYAVWPAASFPQLSSLTSESSCILRPQKNLSNALFDCTTMFEVCNDIPCTGINSELLTSEIVKTDCAIEQYLMDCCMFLFFVLFHAVVANIICSLFLNGIRQVLWRKLCISGLKMHTRVLEDGSLARGQEKEERGKRVSRAVRKLKVSGIVQLLLGTLFMLLWMVSVALLGS